MKYSFFITILVVLFSCKPQEATPDLLIQNATVYLPDGTSQSLDVLVENGRISMIEDKISAKAKQTIDAKGQFLMPGLIDAHAHFEGIGVSKATLNLLGVDSWEATLQAVEKEVAKAKKGEWVIGRGWHQDKWTDTPAKTIAGNPVHDELSAISPDNPVMLSHASGHGILVNAKAMELAGVDAATKSPDGGVIIKDENGEPTGVFQENAETLITNVYQKELESLSEEERYERWLKFIRLAEEECLRYGITSFHDAGITKQNAYRFKDLAEQGDLNVRLFSMLADGEVRDNISEGELKELTSIHDAFFTCNAIKAYMDGALGSRGAWLLEDYHDLPGYRGENVTPIEQLKQTAAIAKKNNMQLCIHAIGDKGNREVIDVFANEMGEDLPQARWRIEHAQHLHPNEIKRIGDLGIIASVQTVHCTSDSPFVEKRLGQKRAEEGAYVWQSLLANQVHIANGTDSPVESVNPFANLYAAVTRKRVNESEAFYPDQKLTRQQALDSYTKWNAYAAFQEDEKGSIEVGKLADFVIVDNNLLTCDEEEILNTKVVYTIVGGEVKYEAKN